MNSIKYILSGISFLIVGFFFLRFAINSSELLKHKKRIMLKVCSIFLFIIGIGMIVCNFVLNEYNWNKMHDDWYYCLDKHKQINIVILDDDMLKNKDFIMYQKDSLEKKGYNVVERKIEENKVIQIKNYVKSFYKENEILNDLMVYIVSSYENEVKQEEFFIRNNSDKFEVLDFYISAVLQNSY